MQTEFIAVPPFWTVGQTIDYMRETEDLPDTFYEIFVVDPGVHLLGSVPLDKLLRSKRPVAVSEIMIDDPGPGRGDRDQEEVARMFERYNLVSAAVVDESDRLVGADDRRHRRRDRGGGRRGHQGARRRQAPSEEISDDVLDTARSRFPWLFANMVTALVASSVIRLFEDSIEQMVALAVLMPIVASMGGNAGTQTMTVTVRALATRDLGRANAWRIVRREVMRRRPQRGAASRSSSGVIAAPGSASTDLGVVIGLAILDGAVGRGPRRHPDPAAPRPARRRSGGLVRPVRDDDHGHRRLLRLPRHRDAVVRARLSMMHVASEPEPLAASRVTVSMLEKEAKP